MTRSRIEWFAARAAAVLVAGSLAALPAQAALTEEAATLAGQTPLYLPASPADPGGLKGYDHDFQIDFAFEADGKDKDKKDKLKAVKPKKAVAGPKVKAGAYTLAPAPAAEPD